MTEEEKKAKELEIAKSLENKLTDLVAAAAEKSFKDATPLATFNAAIEEVKKEISAIGGENGKLADVKKSLDDVITATTKFMKDFESKKEKGFNGQENGLSKAIDDVLDGESYKSFVNGNGQRRTGEMQMKAVSIESNYTGDNLLTQQSNIVAYNPQATKINMRDVVRTIPGDPEFPSFTWQEIFEIDREAAAVSENGSLPVSSFKLREKTESTKRVGTYIPISNRLLKSRIFVKNWLMTYLPDSVKQAENFQILFGDNTGNNLNGVTKVAPVFETELATTAHTLAAGSFKAVATYDGGAKTIVTLSAPLAYTLTNGQKITFAGFANAAYNAEFAISVLTDTQIVLPIAYTAQTEAQCLAASATVKGALYKTISSANEADVIDAAIAYLSMGQYMPSSVALNPVDIFRIEKLKDTMGRPLGLISIVNGTKYISSIPIVSVNSMPLGKFAIGDFMNGANLIQYTGLMLEFADDVTYKLQNQVAAIVQEEVIFPIYNKFAFLYGDFASCKTLLSI